jgi:two-component system, OmpR family, phosphate regulon sensor histidine kinase PhoR
MVAPGYKVGMPVAMESLHLPKADKNTWQISMARNKNQTPKALSMQAAFSSSLAISALLVLLRVFGLLQCNWWVLGSICLGILGIDYLFNFYFIQFYIYRKIKVIYKIIHQNKHSTEFKNEKMNMDRNLLEEVEAEVTEWEKEKEADRTRLEELANYRRHFVGNVSHELKTPIFNVQGYLHTLLDGAIDDPSVRIQYLQKAAKNADRLQIIVEDLEAINRMESGELPLDIREFDIRTLTEDVMGDMEMKAQEKQIQLQLKDGADHHFQVRADRESIRQVLVNLIQNSIKYGNVNGSTKVAFYDLDNYILVEVSDNGIGIAEKHHNHLFDRFYRVDKSRSRDVGGTGLGLAIVKHIVESHGQTITVRSDIGKGATFGFTLEKGA